jgi:hypothetical protein
MTQVLRLDDIEEFEFVRRIPRSAITDIILEGVSQLNERDQIEVFLREILPDKNETPHTSTEIADILTTVTHQGKSLFTAFINKGKSTPNVTAKIASHQISRVRRFPGINLIVLLAVGDIQDDIKADLIQAATDAKADYMFVDAIDVARLFVAHHKICPHEGFPFENGQCKVCGFSVEEPLTLAIKVHEEPRYNVLVHQENSHGPAKRYSAEVWTNHHYSKSTLREIIKKVIWNLRKSRYYRSEYTEERFGDRDADVVAVFVYFDELDRQTRNWYCRALWIDPNLPNANRPARLNGEWLGEIEIDWQKEYDAQRIFWVKNQGDKETWVKKIDLLVPKMDELIRLATLHLAEHEQGRLSHDLLDDQFASYEQDALNLSREAGNTQLPPLDCRDCEQKFQNMTAQCHNVFLPFARWGKQTNRDWKQKLWLVRDALKRYANEKQDFLYEWKKATGRS